MADAYQAVYDAVRSRISNADIGSAVQEAIRNENIGHHFVIAASSIQEAAAEHMRPCVVFRPVLSLDGDSWCALHGDNLQIGVAGFGASPAEAMAAFDKHWYSKKEPSYA